ncbi:MAG: VIT1/CCC1 transporter family protein [Trueperaceae bacterium]|nr:VIT1/CCC1 transporter family protein [Trueperaceae bacterium]
MTSHNEHHKSSRVGWLRAAVLGANDGVVSVSSVVVGVAAASGSSQATILLAGVAALIAGAMSMAAGEYVSVQSQADTEKADLELEKSELEKHPEKELEELTSIYIERGLDENLARQVAAQLTAKDALGSHMRDELGITEALKAKPIQAAFASAAAFIVGGIIPVIIAFFSSASIVTYSVGATTVIALLLLGGLAAYAGGASIIKGALRVTIWGVAAMLLTAAIGSLFGVSA